MRTLLGILFVELGGSLILFLLVATLIVIMVNNQELVVHPCPTVSVSTPVVHNP